MCSDVLSTQWFNYNGVIHDIWDTVSAWCSVYSTLHLYYILNLSKVIYMRCQVSFQSLLVFPKIW